MLTINKLDLTNKDTLSLLKQAPFPVKRLYWIYGVPTDAIRGTHAHRACQEYLIVLQGELTIDLRNREGEAAQLRLTETGQAVYIPPMLWKEIRFTTDTILLVAASELYDPSDYIYEDEFNQLCFQLA
ncbi:sugar 3,4-ketoisomerase [Spirosoma aerolatum]|uniref:sugar 3,4-ketoisomerase n=1 Tax=Spirosoma aerolatum TaxID=1211326 RepID=UPI001474EA0F|nr:FdtA/QdtA family cupin domain-containing protein [Spirosoma aerolatum]